MPLRPAIPREPLLLVSHDETAALECLHGVIRRIRFLHEHLGWDYATLATTFGVAPPTIVEICTYQLWEHVTP